MPYHSADHHANTRIQKDPAVERWVYQRYFGQFGSFRVNLRSMKWLTILYGVVPAAFFFTNEYYTSRLDALREEDINAVRMGRTPWASLQNYRKE